MATIRKSTKARKSASKKSTTRKTATKRRTASKSKVAGKRKASPALAKWRKACRALGYGKKGESFKPIPRRGTAAYKKIKALYSKMA